MGDYCNERLKQLASTQEMLVAVNGFTEEWLDSQKLLEKVTYDTINITDTMLNLSQKGNEWVSLLQPNYNKMLENPSEVDRELIARCLKELHYIFVKIQEAIKAFSDSAHAMDRELVHHKEIMDHIQSSVTFIGSNINQIVAFEEFVELSKL